MLLHEKNEMCGSKKPNLIVLCVSTLVFGLLISPASSFAVPQAAAPAPNAQDPSIVKAVGTVKSVSGQSVTLATDAGSELTITATDATKFLRVAPGEKDIKQATPIALGDLQAGDRILVRAKKSDDGKTVSALSIIAMAKTDVAAKQAQDREEWQKHGLGGIVTAVDTAAPTVTISTTVMGEKKQITINIAKTTVLRRYAPDSIKFDDAKPAPLDAVHAGDQLRARGTRSADGTSLAADEIVSGTFRNISGTISMLDAAAGTLVVQDLTTKKPVTVKISADSQLRKLTAPIAQRIAARMKGESPAAGGAAGAAAAPQQTSATPNAGAPSGGGSNGNGPTGGAAGPGGRAGGGQGGDLQQMISRMPAASLSDLQKGDAVMLVSTEGTAGGAVTAITLLAGVEPILQASPGNSSLLSAWSLGGAPGGDSGTP
jgi:uncharacterized protein DUF5666